MSFRTFSLHQLGWRPDYAQHLTLDDFEAGTPARVLAVHAARLEVYASSGIRRVERPDHLAGADVAVGDWLMVERESPSVRRRLPRRSLLEGLSADGAGRMAVANLDTLLVVLRGDDDLAVTRAARHVALATDAGIEPLVLAMGTAARLPSPQLRAAPTIVASAEGAGVLRQLASWLVPGHTLAIAGPSGSATRGLIRSLTAGASPRASVGDDARVRVPGGLLATATGAWIVDLMVRRHGQRVTSGGPCHARRCGGAPAVAWMPLAHS